MNDWSRRGNCFIPYSISLMYNFSREQLATVHQRPLVAIRDACHQALERVEVDYFRLTVSRVVTKITLLFHLAPGYLSENESSGFREAESLGSARVETKDVDGLELAPVVFDVELWFLVTISFVSIGLNFIL